MKRFLWLYFIILGLLYLLPAVSSFFILRQTPDHWDWLTQDAEVLDYLASVWRLVGLFQLSLSVLMIIIAATGFRKGERWGWYLLWLWLPILAGQAVFQPWIWPIYAVLILIAVVVLWLTRPLINKVPNEVETAVP